MTHNLEYSIETNKHAVIDVGSNSVRLVIYQISGGSFVPIHNEKVLAGLGRGIGETGQLSKIGVELALNAIRRFKTLIDALGIDSYDAIATAAARDAQNGNEFIRIINEEIGLKISLISGEEEGRLSALGVQYGAPNAHGIMGDLGGSSLELVNLNQINGHRESWHLGPLAIGEIALSKNLLSNLQNINDKIHCELDNSQVLKTQNIKEFHAVGGGWRNIAQLHMHMQNYPLMVLQNYEIEREEAKRLCQYVMVQTKRNIEKTPGISQRRADALPYAALLLYEILAATDIEKVIISSYGLREGLLHEKFAANTQSDPLVEASISISKAKNDDIEFAQALYIWCLPILKTLSQYENNSRAGKLLLAAAHLGNIGIGLHPDHRAYLTYQMVLRGPYPCASHKERVFLARSIARRYGAKNDEIEAFECANLIDAELAILADVYGAAMRLGANLCANSSKILKDIKLIINDGAISLDIPSEMANIFSQSVRKRLDQLVASYAKAMV